jgi:hypothetical protein
MTMKRALLLALGALLVLGLGFGLPSGAEEERCLPLPQGDAIAAYCEKLQVGPPTRHANLTLYPIFAEDVRIPLVDLTLDEAMDRKLVEIRELSPAEVNRVLLMSNAKEPIFIMGGEMLVGAKQDRIAGDDMIVPPGGDLAIPVFCVEHGRWVAKSGEFGSAAFLAPSGVRKARAAADQSAVWSEVAAEQERLDAPSATGAFRSVQDSREVQDRLAPYRRGLADFARDLSKARGVVACVGDEIIAADLFGSRALFLQLWPRLLDSYAIDAVGRNAKGAALDAVTVKRWLDTVKRAGQTQKETPGLGDLYELRGQSVLGAALVYEGGVVHMELFSKDVPEPVPFNRLDFRRERLEEDVQQAPQR